MINFFGTIHSIVISTTGRTGFFSRAESGPHASSMRKYVSKQSPYSKLDQPRKGRKGRKKMKGGNGKTNKHCRKKGSKREGKKAQPEIGRDNKIKTEKEFESIYIYIYRWILLSFPRLLLSRYFTSDQKF